MSGRRRQAVRCRQRSHEEVAVNGSLLRRFGVALAAGSTVLLTSGVAVAADKPTAVLTCDGGLQFEAAIVSLGTFHESISLGNFQLKYLAFGDTVVRDTTGVTNNHDLLTCTYVGPSSGNHYVVKGFFTPAS
jgi:hypothetical protein